MGSVIKRPWDGEASRCRNIITVLAVFPESGRMLKILLAPLQVSPAFFAIDSKAARCLSRRRRPDYEKFNHEVSANSLEHRKCPDYGHVWSVGLRPESSFGLECHCSQYNRCNRQE